MMSGNRGSGRPRKYLPGKFPTVLCLHHRRICLERGIYFWRRRWWSTRPTGSNQDWWCQFMECWFSFASWWYPPVVIVTPCERSLLTTGSFTHSVPFTGRGSTWHPQIIYHPFLGLYCCCLHCHNERTSPPRVVDVPGIVVLDFVMVNYVIDGGCSIWLIVHTQEGNVLQVISNHWVSFRIVWNKEAHQLKSLGPVVRIATCVGLFEFHVCCGCIFF